MYSIKSNYKSFEIAVISDETIHQKSDFKVILLSAFIA